MGAFIISDISFKTQKDRERFEKKFKWLKKKDILVDESSNSYGFGAWTVMRNPTIDVIYHMRFMGYAEPIEMLKECLKEGIKITFWAWIPINDRNTHWEKLKGRW